MPSWITTRRGVGTALTVALVVGLLGLVLVGPGSGTDEAEDRAGLATAGPSPTRVAPRRGERPASPTTGAPTTVSVPLQPTTAPPAPTTPDPGPAADAVPGPTQPPTTVAPTAAPATVPPGPATGAPATGAKAGDPPPVRDLAPYRGLGAWLDVWDWSPTYTGGRNGFALTDVDGLAAQGVQTVYIQTSRWDRSEDLLDEALLRSIVERAHRRGMKVVGWYLPTFDDEARDLRRLQAAARVGVDGIGVDIEAREYVSDAAERSRRLLRLSSSLRATVPHLPLAAVVFPPVASEIINQNFWPGFPWEELGPHYDVWMPMAYWTYRTPESGWRDPHRYIATNVDLLRDLLGDPALAVHPVGGEAATLTAGDVEAMARAVAERGAIGGSLYDALTTGAHLWEPLRALRR